MAQLRGGYTDEVEADAEIQKLCDEVKEEVLKQSGLNLKAFEMYKALKYRRQVVAGLNYRVKIQICSSGECVHVKIFQALQCYGGQKSVSGIETNKTIEDSI